MHNSTANSIKVTTSRGDGYLLCACRYIIPKPRTILLVALWLLSFLMNGDVKPLVKRGFFCKDTSINYPYHQDTIGVKTLFFISLILPGILIKFCDTSFDRIVRSLLSLNGGSNYRSMRKQRKMSDISQDELNLEEEEEEEFISKKTQVKRRIPAIDEGETECDNSKSPVSHGNVRPEEDDEEEVDLFTRVPLDSDNEHNGRSKRRTEVVEPPIRTFGEFQLFFFGFSTTMLLTGIGKITCGRFRPHFIERCKPDIDCLSLENSYRYIEQFNCTNTELRSRDLSYIATSWPSGHASVMFYSMFYLVFYLSNLLPSLVQLTSSNKRQRFDPLALYAIYILMISLAGYIAMTRVSDYHHHPTDVLSGSILGTIIAIVTSKFLSRQYLKESNYVFS